MPKKVTKKRVRKTARKVVTPANFYRASLASLPTGHSFYKEYNIFVKAIEAVNSFNEQYRGRRTGTQGGSPPHTEQDLYRAMLIFACAGLDALVKHLVANKLAPLVELDETAKLKFRDYVKSGLEKGEKELLNIVALSMIERRPRDIFLRDYIDSMTGESLQSKEQLIKAASISGLKISELFPPDVQNSLKDAFGVRNQIIHEMDLNLASDASGTIRYRTRRVRTAAFMEKHTRAILDISQEILRAYISKFEELQIGTAKKKEV